MKEISHTLVVENMSKSYGKLRALKPTSLTVEPGEIVGLVGPNGAGKTTLLECIVGLKKPDAGRAWIAGFDTKSERADALRHCGIQFQDTVLPPFTRLADAIWLWRGIYREVEDPLKLCEEFGVADKYKSLFFRLSGGQKRKALIALAFLGKPDLAILDEPTSGLDPATRAQFWGAIRKRRELGKSVLVTSHQLAEMDTHCDRIAIIFDGTVRSYGTVDSILKDYEARMTYLAYSLNIDVAKRVAQILSGIDGVTWVNWENSELRVVTRAELKPDLERAIQDAGIELPVLVPRPSNMEDVFLMETYGAVTRTQSIESS